MPGSLSLVNPTLSAYSMKASQSVHVSFDGHCVSPLRLL